MVWLPLANVLHHKTRSVLSSLGIGIGICLLVTLSGLSRGSLFEVADRWESVDADLIVIPRGWGNSMTVRSGIGLSDRYVPKILAENGDIVDRVVPVFSWPLKVGGQNHQAAGVSANDFSIISGRRQLREGRLADPTGAAAGWIERRLLSGGDADGPPIEISSAELGDANHNALELVVDSRLARVGKFHVGQTIETANHRWTIVGIAPDGVMSRVFLPRRTAQYLFGGGDITKSTVIFVKLKSGVDVGPAARKIEQTTNQDVVPLTAFRGMLAEQWKMMFVMVNAVDAIALIIAFLFVMVMLYTTVLQRRREIAILKSCGASDAFILRQVLGESMLLTALGTVMGILLSLLAAGLIELVLPLLTVKLTWTWLGIAVAAAAAGAAISAVYPAWRATRVDVTEALTLE